MHHPNRLLHLVTSLLLSLALTACNLETFEFAQTGTAQLVTGETYTNPVPGSFRGVDYASSNPQVAQVDGSGRVTAVGPGRARISARLDGQSIAYSVEVVNRRLRVSAWVGPTGADWQLSDGTEGTWLHTTSDANCNPVQTGNCANAASQLMLGTGSVLPSAALTLSQPGYFRVQYGEHQAAGALAADRFAGRWFHSVVAFRGRLWVIGGLDNGGQYRTDIWSSTDGTTWVPEQWDNQSELLPSGDASVVGDVIRVVLFNNALWLIDTHTGALWSTLDSPEHARGFVWQEQGSIGAGFEGRSGSPVVVSHDGDGTERLWLIGGWSTGNDNRNDVWTSPNGTDWARREPSANGQAFTGRSGHQAVFFKNRLWVIGGLIGPQYVNDIWSSADGRDWREETSQAEFSGRTGHRVVVYNDGRGERLWLVGGDNDDNELNDVWSSSDGIHWRQEAVDAAFPIRRAHALAVFNQQLWVVGGNGGSYLNDVWSSRNGQDWQPHTAEAAFSGRDSHQAIAFADRLWVIGGLGGSYNNDVWSSADGLHWQQHRVHADFSPRRNHGVVVFNQRLWLVGGSYRDDVWSSADGVQWQRVLAEAPFSPRAAHALVVFDHRLWVIGGSVRIDGRYQWVNDVWSSSNGRDWIEETAQAGFSARVGHQAVVFNGQLWVIGGRGAGGDNGVVWSSHDGRHWQSRPDANLTARYGHQALVTQDAQGERLWVLGGYNSEGKPDNQVWTTRNGTHWTAVDSPQSQANRFTARTYHQALSFRNQLWVIGGTDESGTPLHDVWRSAEGANWQKGVQVEVEFEGP
ncbi:Ig-like domain-containing protein [Saccharospirillum mangrovi]|nr:Ig-like domain-containing protein [Saccharospirillum mangrovi]